MFTGLVESLAEVHEIVPDGPGVRLAISVPDDLDASDSTRIGDSVALNGCCLTVVEIRERNWWFQAGAETLSRTNLGQFTVGDFVNIERSLPVDGRLGGHFVQGHIDGTGTVAAVEQDGEWTNLRFDVPSKLTQQMVEKGSVAVDGVSLTLVDVNESSFSVALIPHTLEVTTLGRCRPGDTVNIETDILGKYVQKLVGVR